MKEHRAKRVTILVAEADESLRNVHRRLFEKAGYTVETVGTLKDAVPLVNRKVFDAALICLEMPNGNGLDLLSHIRRVSPETVCVVLTVLDLPEARERAKLLGAIAYLIKPIQPEELLRVVKEKLREQVTEVGKKI